MTALVDFYEAIGFKFNPHHDAVGKFASSGGGGGAGRAQLSSAEQNTAIARLDSLEKVEAYLDGPKDEVLCREAGWVPQKHLEVYNEIHAPDLTSKQKKYMVDAVIPKDKIHYAQSTVSVEGTSRFIKQMPPVRPVLVQSPAGELWVASGHRRLTAQWLAGRDSAPVSIMKVNPRGKQLQEVPDLTGILGAQVEQVGIKEEYGEKFNPHHDAVGKFAKTGGVEWGENVYKSYPDAPHPPIVSAFAISALRRETGGSDYVNVYHVTTKDRLDTIKSHGLVPGAERPSGQTWKAEHSDYATYFHSDKKAAVANALQGGEGSIIIRVAIPLKQQALQRVLPDEDVTRDINKGVGTLIQTGSVAIIGGAPRGSCFELPSSSWYKELHTLTGTKSIVALGLSEDGWPMVAVGYKFNPSHDPKGRFAKTGGLAISGSKVPEMNGKRYAKADDEVLLVRWSTTNERKNPGDYWHYTTSNLTASVNASAQYTEGRPGYMMVARMKAHRIANDPINDPDSIRWLKSTRRNEDAGFTNMATNTSHVLGGIKKADIIDAVPTAGESKKALPPSTYPFEDERLATERKLSKAVASALAAIQQAVFKKLDREARSLKELIEEYGEKYNPHHDARGRFAKTGGVGGGETVTLWHGTPAENAAPIASMGLRVGKSRNFDASDPGVVYVAKSEDAAAHVGEIAVLKKYSKESSPLGIMYDDGAREKAWGKQYAVIEIAYPKAELMRGQYSGKVTIDKDFQSQGLVFKDGVPREYLVGAKVYSVGVVNPKTGRPVPPTTMSFKEDTIALYAPVSVEVAKALLEGKGTKALSDVPADQTFWDEQKAAFFEQAGPATQDALMAAAAQASSFGLAADFDLINQGVLEFTRTFGDEWWGRLEGTTREGLRAAIGANISTGAPLSNLKKSLEPLFGKTRADMIASTETTRLYAEGNSIAYRAAGVTQLEFRTAREFHLGKGGVCDLCAGRDGEKFPIDDAASRPPLHVRCRCFVVPVVDGEALAVPGEFQPFDPYTAEAWDAYHEMEHEYLGMEEAVNPGASKLGAPWSGISQERRSAMKANVAERIATRSGLSSDTVDGYLRTWAKTSSDGDIQAVAMQVAASERYGLPMTDFIAEAAQKFAALPASPFDEVFGGTVWSRHVAEADKVLVAMQAETQALLKAQGIETVKLYRGMRWGVGEYPPTEIGDFIRNRAEVLGPWPIGPSTYAEEIEFVSNPLSSWAINPKVASEFGTGTGKTGVVLAVEVPVEAIVSTPMSGIGCLNEFEFVVRGGTYKTTIVSGDDLYARLLKMAE